MSLVNATSPLVLGSPSRFRHDQGTMRHGVMKNFVVNISFGIFAIHTRLITRVR